MIQSFTRTRTRLALSLVVIVIGAAAFAYGADPDRTAQETPGTFAFENVSVIPMDAERVAPDQTVVVRDGVIVAN